MYTDEIENKRDSIRRAATLSAIVGPMVALMLVGFIARLQNFFCPANFMPLYAVSFIVLAPGFYMIGLSGAESALRLSERGTARWPTLLLLAAGGSILGALYFESLAFVLVRALPDYSPLLTLPGLQASLALAAGLAATWIVLFGVREPQALSLR
jgi:hypothetical protein